MAKIYKLFFGDKNPRRGWRQGYEVTLIAENGKLISGTCAEPNMAQLIRNLIKAKLPIDEAAAACVDLATGQRKPPKAASIDSINKMHGWKKLKAVCQRCRSMRSLVPTYATSGDNIIVMVGRKSFSKKLEDQTQDLDILAEEALEAFGY
jgi:hypothetical protein